MAFATPSFMENYVPKICNINFWIENDPTPPLALFKKFIRFGSGTLPIEQNLFSASKDSFLAKNSLCE